MDISNLLFVGTKRHIAAFRKVDGTLLWKTELNVPLLSAATLVAILVEGRCVYAHFGGELYCLDAFSGQQLWNNKLEGLGYGFACLAVDGVSASPTAATHPKYTGSD